MRRAPAPGRGRAATRTACRHRPRRSAACGRPSTPAVTPAQRAGWRRQRATVQPTPYGAPWCSTFAVQAAPPPPPSAAATAPGRWPTARCPGRGRGRRRAAGSPAARASLTAPRRRRRGSPPRAAPSGRGRPPRRPSAAARRARQRPPARRRAGAPEAASVVTQRALRPRAGPRPPTRPGDPAGEVSPDEQGRRQRLRRPLRPLRAAPAGRPRGRTRRTRPARQPGARGGSGPSAARDEPPGAGPVRWGDHETCPGSCRPAGGAAARRPARRAPCRPPSRRPSSSWAARPMSWGTNAGGRRHDGDGGEHVASAAGERSSRAPAPAARPTACRG